MKTITIEGPGKNALSMSLMAKLSADIAAAGDAPLLLTGAGDTFCAGLDLKEVLAFDLEGMAAFLRALEGLARAIFAHPAPTCAVVNGHAIAGGCILALCCDLRVAAAKPKAKIGLNEVALGLLYPPGLLRLVEMRVPRSRLEEIVLGAGLHAPQRAMELGMVDAVEQDAMAWAERELTARAKLSPQAYASAKAVLRKAALAPHPEDDERFMRDGLVSWISPELKATLRKILRM